MGRRLGVLLACVLLAVLAVGCGSSPQPSALPVRPIRSPTATPAPSPTAPSGSIPVAGPIPAEGPGGWQVTYPAHCVARDSDELPDPACTPGAINPDVTQANIHQTICVSGWTATVRPPLAYTSKVKGLAIRAYGSYAGSSFGAYELDHLVPLELGGAPWDIRNLWASTPASPNQKDSVEYAARQAVCAGRMTLVAAQQAIAVNWVALGHRLGVAGIPAS